MWMSGLHSLEYVFSDIVRNGYISESRIHHRHKEKKLLSTFRPVCVLRKEAKPQKAQTTKIVLTYVFGYFFRTWVDRSPRNVEWSFLHFVSKDTSTKTIHFKKPTPKTKLTLMTREFVMVSLAEQCFQSYLSRNGGGWFVGYCTGAEQPRGNSSSYSSRLQIIYPV